jgi:hypothetical protein
MSQAIVAGRLLGIPHDDEQRTVGVCFLFQGRIDADRLSSFYVIAGAVTVNMGDYDLDR